MVTLTLVPQTPVRRDKRGRKIGHNWWREYNTSLWRDAHDAWLHRRESSLPAFGAAGAAHSDVCCYQLSDREYRELYPEPTLREMLVANKGMNAEQEAA